MFIEVVLNVLRSFLILGLLIAGCGRPKGVPGITDSDPKNLTEGVPTFDKVFNQIFSPKCLKCHSSGSMSLKTYEDTMNSGWVIPKDPKASKLYSEVESGDMPKGGPPLSAEELNLISKWIELGAPKGEANPPAPTPTPEPTPAPTPEPGGVTFKFIYRNILNPRCVGCHGGSGGYSFDRYKDVMEAVTPGDPEKSLLYTEVASGAMPDEGPKLSPEQVQQIKDWILSGAPNN